MASTAPTVYLPENPQGQPISFNAKTCDDYCLVISNNQGCDENAVSNPLFLGTITPAWTIVNVVQTGSDPCTISGPLSSAPELHQAITLENSKPYILYYSFESDAGAWGCTLQDDAISAPTALWSGSSTLIQRGYKRFTSGGAPTTLELVFALPANDTPVTCHYAFICEDVEFIGESDFCFQLPLFETGTELLVITGEEIDLATETATHTGTTNVSDTGTIAAERLPSETFDSVHGASNIGRDGFYFIDYEVGSATISAGQDSDIPAEAVDQQIRIQYQISADSVFENNRINVNTLTNGFKTASSLTMASGNSWEVKLRSWFQDVGGTGTVDYSFTDLDTKYVEMFYDKTFTAEDDTFYRLSYKLNKCSGSTVTITDSAGAPILTAASNGVKFDKIFKTGTLPTTTVTVRVDINDMLLYPQDEYYNSVLTEVQLYKMCKWDARIETDADVFVSNLTETHDTTSESAGLSYNPNIEYCLDTLSLTAGCYQFRALDDCDGARTYVSNCITVCNLNKSLTEIAWTLGRTVCSGNEILDYVAYPSTQYLWIQADLQDFAVLEENEVYRRSDGFWEKPWAYQKSVEVLQVWPAPAFVRQALALAMTGTFTINGVDYQKLNDDSFEPAFRAMYQSPMRILVTRVGDFVISRE